MTTNPEVEETGPTQDDMEFFGQLVAANVNFANAATNTLLDLKDQQIADWKNHYAMLYRSMRKVYRVTDSATARDALDRFEHLYGEAVASDEEGY